MDQNPQDTDYVVTEPDTSSQGPTPVTDEPASREVHEQAAREKQAREAAEREAGRRRVEDAMSSGMADIG